MIPHLVRFIKRAISALLILFQIANPAHADLAGDMQNIFGNQLKQAVSQQLASIIGLHAPNNPAAERALTALMSQKANTASLIFDSPLTPQFGSGSGPQVSIEIYDPANFIQTQKQVARWRAFVRLTKNKPALTESDLTEAAQALLPFLRYYAHGLTSGPQAAGNTITVPPGAEIAFSLAGYCMDRTAPAPMSGEKLQLVPITQLVPETALPVYQAMMQFSAANIDKRSEIQNLVWGLRHAADPYPPIKELNSRQTALLDEAAVNGAQSYTDYLSAQSQASKATEGQKQLYRTIMGGIQSKLNITLPDATRTGYSEQDTNSLIAALTRMPVEGVPQAKSEYSLLTDGVAAKTIASNLHKINVQVRNTTALPFTFDANSYAGQSTRVTQRVAFGGIDNANIPSGPSAVQRLQDVLQKLEIAPLKRFQAQIQQFIDRNAGLAGDGRLKLAGLALATAMNQVLLPTSGLDVAALAMPLGKLGGVVERIGAKEVLAVEQAAKEFLIARHEALGVVTGRWTAVEPGPLAEKYAETFAGSRYSGIVLAEDTTLYRAGSGAPGKELGEYLSLDPADGILQTRVDRAIQPVWPGGALSVIDTSYAVKVPAGTTVYTGKIGYQGGFYLGGNWQIVVPTPWKIPGVVATKIGVLK